MRLSVIIPAYNEEKSLGEVLASLEQFMRENGHDAEVIVVDDGSKDGTSLLASGKGVHVLRHKKNRGYGASLKTGIRAAKNDIILIIDADGSYPIDEIGVLLEKIVDNDMVVGARIKKGSVNMSLLRRLPKFLLRKLSEYLVNEHIPDINSGLRVFKKSLFEKYVNILPNTFSFTLTITLSALSGHANVEFVPISYHKRQGVSKIRPFYDTSNFILLIIRTILFFNPVRVFLPAALVFIATATAVALYSTFVMGEFLDVTVTLLFVFGVQLIVLGLIADLINRKVH